MQQRNHAAGPCKVQRDPQEFDFDTHILLPDGTEWDYNGPCDDGIVVEAL